MIYVFHDNQMYYYGAPWDMDIPQHSVIYDQVNKIWLIKHDSQHFRPIKLKHVPKEIKVLCLLLDIPI